MTDNIIDNQLNKAVENTQQKIDEEIEQAYKKSEQLVLIPLLKLIYNTIKIDYGKDFKLKYPLSSNKSKEIKTGEIILTSTDQGENKEIISKKFKVYLDLVPKDYDLNNSLIENNILSANVDSIINETNEHLKKQLIELITYLTQSAKIVFSQLKNKYQELIEYNLELDNNTTIYVDFESNLRLGIIFKMISEEKL